MSNNTKSYIRNPNNPLKAIVFKYFDGTKDIWVSQGTNMRLYRNADKATEDSIMGLADEVVFHTRVSRNVHANQAGLQ